jgi:hypothetical protein
MTLDEMMADLGKRWETWPQDGVTSKAANGMAFRTFRSGGVKVEGASCGDPKLLATPSLAVDHLLAEIVKFFEGQGPIIYWRERPMLMRQEDFLMDRSGWTCSCRVVVGPKP